MKKILVLIFISLFLSCKSDKSEIKIIEKKSSTNIIKRISKTKTENTTDKENIKPIIEKKISVEPFTLYGDEISLFVGIQSLKPKDIRTGIYIKIKSKTEISYRYSKITNWKEKIEINGIAKVIGFSEIEIKGKGIKAFNFIDEDKKIKILITVLKKERRAIVYKDNILISAIMNYK